MDANCAPLVADFGVSTAKTTSISCFTRGPPLLGICAIWLLSFCKLPTLYWLPKLHKRLSKLRFIANSSSCATIELSILSTCLIWSVKISGEILNKMESKGLSTHDVSILFFINQKCHTILHPNPLLPYQMH